MNLIRSNRLENEVAQAGSDNDPRVWFVRFPPLKRVVGKQPGAFDEPRDKP